jgi:predicted transcriptional regulator
MSLLSGIRDGLLLKRLVVALESIAESQRTLAELATSAAAPESFIKDVRPTVVSSMDVAATNREYKRHIMETHGLATDEDYADWLERQHG